jgi:cytochrome c oxidase subunit II
VSAAGPTAPGAVGPDAEPPHAVRIAVTWAVLSLVVLPVVIFLIGPSIPPGHASQQSSDQHQINVTLSAIATPIVLLVWVYFGYAAIFFRQRGEEIVDGPPIVGHARIQMIWMVATTLLVLTLATLGTIDLFSGTAAGAGGGQGPNPLSKPSNPQNVLEVQVIGQQWLWTFRYPAYGGVETDSLVLPVNREIAFHVTSLDVVHSFWAVELGVKADAVPGNDNVAYVKPEQVRDFQVRCAELCGIWHGNMNTTARVITQAGFAAWIAQAQRTNASSTKQLPPYSHVYYPEPSRRAS